MRSHVMFRRLAGAFLLLGLLAPGARADMILQQYPKCSATVDWSTRRATVHGYAPLAKHANAAAIRKARAAATADARANVVRLAQALVPIAADNPRRAAMLNAVRRMAQHCRITGARALPDGRYEVTLVVLITGRAGMSGALAKDLRRMPRIALAGIEKSATRGDVPPTTGEEDLLTKSDAKGPFTGVIIDARSYGVVSSMSPAVYDAQNKEVYNGSDADVDFVEDVGVAGYAGTIKTARENKRVGKNPLILRATGSPDQFHRAVSITDEDAKRLLGADKESHFLKKCAVLLVIDKQDGS